jgi:hypothetical protein
MGGGQAATLVELRLNANEKQAQYQLNITSKYLKRLGTKISTSKCLTFQIKTRRDICYTVDPNLKIAEKKSQRWTLNLYSNSSRQKSDRGRA